MIARLRGVIWEKEPGRLVLDAGGVGYSLAISTVTAAQLGEPGERTEVYVTTILREDSLQLYGFARPEERALFELLIGVSGIGPKTAVGALSALTPADLLAAVAEDEPARLVRVPGIGKKTAERLIVELRDKVAGLKAYVGAAAAPSTPRQDALEALVALGYARAAAERALADIGSAETTIQDVLRVALQKLSALR